MASKHESDGEWVVRRPLQLESIRKGLPDSEESDKLVKRLQQHRENLDAVVYALSSRKLAPDRRSHLLEILRRNQNALDESLAELGLVEPGFERTPQQQLSHFNQLDPVARSHLVAILGVPEEPAFYEVLDIKAEEYLAQRHAFESLTEQLGYRERDSLARSNKRAALVLTLSGSLIQISEPTGSGGARRYFYQNIYGNAHPPEGTLVLDRDIRLGHRIRSVELTTSPVRLLRVVERKLSWKAQSQAFERISRTLTSLVSRSTSQIAAIGADVRAPTGVIRHANLVAAERVLRQEYGEAFDHFDQLRTRFSAEGEEGRQVEAELLTLCHFLQTGARELGFEARALTELCEFSTAGENLYRIDPDQPSTITLLPRGTGPEVVFVEISIGRQLITRMAPLALIGRDGAVVEVTLPVLGLKRR
jgi:hypothetical protein